VNNRRSVLRVDDDAEEVGNSKSSDRGEGRNLNVGRVCRGSPEFSTDLEGARGC